MFSWNADKLRGLYYCMMIEDERLAKMDGSSILKYLNDASQINQFVNLNQPLRFKKGK